MPITEVCNCQFKKKNGAPGFVSSKHNTRNGPFFRLEYAKGKKIKRTSSQKEPFIQLPGPFLQEAISILRIGGQRKECAKIKNKNKRGTRDGQPDLRTSSLLPRQGFPKSQQPQAPSEAQRPQRTPFVFFEMRARRRAARPIKVFGGRRHDEKARRKCREKAPSRGQNTSVALASLPATTVAAGGETRARKRASIQPSSN